MKTSAKTGSTWLERNGEKEQRLQKFVGKKIRWAGIYEGKDTIMLENGDILVLDSQLV